MSKYKKGKIEVASVTTIISDCTDKSGALTQWSANMVCEWIRQNAIHSPGLSEKSEFLCVTNDMLNEARFNFREVSKEALDIGSAVHHAIEHYLKTGEEPKDPPDKVLSAFLAFLEFKDEHKLETIETELTVWDKDNRWAGTLDWLGWMDGKVTVLDWKTNKGKIYKESHYQIAAYRSAKGVYIDEIQSCGCVRIDKETGMYEYKCTDKSYEQDLVVFNDMVKLYYDRHPRNRKKAGLS